MSDSALISYPIFSFNLVTGYSAMISQPLTPQFRRNKLNPTHETPLRAKCIVAASGQQFDGVKIEIMFFVMLNLVKATLQSQECQFNTALDQSILYLTDHLHVRL